MDGQPAIDYFGKHDFDPGAGYYAMQKIILSSLIFFFLAESALTKGVKMDAYAMMIANNCQIRTGDATERFFAKRIDLKQKDIRIRKLQKGWKGWLRVHAICKIDGGTIWGYADVHTRSGKTICDARNWEVRIRGTKALR